MSWRFIVSSFETYEDDAVVDFDGNHSFSGIYVSPGVSVASDVGAGIYSTYSGGQIIVDGTVLGGNTAIRVDTVYPELAYKVTINASGLVWSPDSFAIDTSGSVLINNAGTIRGTNFPILDDVFFTYKYYAAVNLEPGNDTFKATMNNTGLIKSDDGFAIGRSLSPAGGKIVIVNSGTIEGHQETAGIPYGAYDGRGDNGAVVTGNADPTQNRGYVDSITNTGKMVGAIYLGDGADRYDGRQGHLLNGKIDAGAGNDTIYGGSDKDSIVGGDGADDLRGYAGNDTLNAGASSDRLHGGVGRDTLSGGADADKFVFVKGDSGISTGNADTITDWTAADSIDTNITGTSSNYYEHSVAASVDTIEEAALYAEKNAGSSIRHAFLYNSTTDVGYLLMDLDSNGAFETGVILNKAGTAAEFSYSDLI